MKYLVTATTLLGICSTLSIGAELKVQVINGTTEGAAVTDDEVIVQIYEDRYLLHTFSARANAEGRAVFENVPEGEHLTAVARARHQDMMFTCRGVSLRPSEDGHVASVQVFDVSTDKSKLSVGTHHLIVKVKPGSLEITEYMQLKNSSDFAITSSEKDEQDRTIVLHIKLPRGFKNLRALSYFEADALVVTDEGFYDTMAIPPGEQHITFSYTLDVTSQVMGFAKTISLRTSEFVLFAELGAAKIHGLGQIAEQAARSSGEFIQYYTRADLAAGEEVAFQLVNLDVGSSGLAKWIIAGAVISAIVVLVILRLSPKEKANDNSEQR
ncbi:MAG: hypothetical protein AMJ65_17310 [Phycisphaerae bacterium SG8_4]|nr:MAG: hypothetical protein AMJ65_17310 [Phycisphaerae bacterium SG8_4]